MVSASIQKYLNQFLTENLGLQISHLQWQALGGGSINDTYRVKINDKTSFFLKINSASKYPGLFTKEKHGLEFLTKQKIIHIPSVVFYGANDGYQVLLLEWIDRGSKTEQFWKKFGEELAALHHITNSHFGFEEDNYMGSLPQINTQKANWIEFFVDCRLRPQVSMAEENHLLQARHLNAFENLYLQLPNIFNEEKPFLLHGDLWSGNYMCDQFSEPVLIDPAVYFGHRSMDLAMTTLFGGFDKSFYESYNYHFPFPSNHLEQWELCNLYPLLIHLNLFGFGYLGQIESTLANFR